MSDDYEYSVHSTHGIAERCHAICFGSLNAKEHDTRAATFAQELGIPNPDLFPLLHAYRESVLAVYKASKTMPMSKRFV